MLSARSSLQADEMFYTTKQFNKETNVLAFGVSLGSLLTYSNARCCTALESTEAADEVNLSELSGTLAWSVQSSDFQRSSTFPPDGSGCKGLQSPKAMALVSQKLLSSSHRTKLVSPQQTTTERSTSLSPTGA